MSCKLSTHEQYPLNSVQYDKGTGKLAVHLSNPPQASCPDGFFTSAKATLTVDPNITVSALTYTNHPVILVPSKGVVQEIDSTPPSSFSFGTFLILALIALAVYGYFKGWFNKFFNNSPQSETVNVSQSGASASMNSARPSPPPPPPAPHSRSHVGRYNTASRTSTASTYQPSQQTVVVHDGGGMSNFVGGMLVGEALSGGSSHTTDREVIHDHEVIHDSPNYSLSDNFSSDDSSSYSSDDSSSSFSSDDSSSSYSSDDSSSSFSSDDSSSSYSSDDSSSSFSSDN